MNILVTGGAGYLGTLLVPRLLAAGHAVTLYDSFAFGMQPVLHFAAHPALTITTGDVRDAAKLGGAVAAADAVIHLAAIVGYPACAADPARATDINVNGTRNVVEALRGDQRVVFASTGSTYGKVDGICDEDTPIAPLTLYGSTKAEGEKMMVDAGAVALRFATVFGVSPRLRLDLLVNDFVHQALHARQIILYEGGFRRTFLHSTDAAAAITWALDNAGALRGESFNIGSDAMNYTKREIALLVRERIDYYLHEADVGEDLDKRDYEVSYAKATERGFATEVGMAAGIAELERVVRHVRVPSPWRNI